MAKVLECLQKYRLFMKLSKCKFSIDMVDFLGFILGTEGIAIEQSWVQTIQEWPEPMTFHKVQVFLGFANFYRQFIAGYSRIAGPLTAMLQGSKDSKKTGPYDMTPEVRMVFSKLKAAFVTTPVLQHFDPAKLICLETDASEFAIAGILS